MLAELKTQVVQARGPAARLTLVIPLPEFITAFPLASKPINSPSWFSTRASVTVPLGSSFARKPNPQPEVRYPPGVETVRFSGPGALTIRLSEGSIAMVPCRNGVE